MLGEIFDRFVKESPVTVMTRGLLERLLNPRQLDAWFERTAEKQYTQERLFSTVVDLLMQVVCGVRKSVNVAYQAVEHEMKTAFQQLGKNFESEINTSGYPRVALFGFCPALGASSRGF